VPANSKHHTKTPWMIFYDRTSRCDFAYATGGVIRELLVIFVPLPAIKTWSCGPGQFMARLMMARVRSTRFHNERDRNPFSSRLRAGPRLGRRLSEGRMAESSWRSLLSTIKRTFLRLFLLLSGRELPPTTETAITRCGSARSGLETSRSGGGNARSLRKLEIVRSAGTNSSGPVLCVDLP